MAFNTKYILKYCNRSGVPLRVELQLRDYVGETFIIVNNKYLQDEDGNYVVANVDGSYDPERDMNKIESDGNPFTLVYKNDTGKKDGTIRATHANMSFYEDLSFNIDDLATTDETGIRCLFYYDNELEWIGYVTPDFFNVEITSNPVINLTASDRIGVLKDIPYPITNIFTDSRISYGQVVSKVLKQTGLDLNINVLADFDNKEFVGVGFNPFLDIYVSELRFLKSDQGEDSFSCYDVLKSVCDTFNCFVTQYKGEWYILNKRQVELGVGRFFILDSDGDLIRTKNYEQEEFQFGLIDTGGERTIIPAGGKNTYLLNHGDNKLYPTNRTFRGTTISISGWNLNTPYVGTGFSVGDTLPIRYNSDGTFRNWYEDSRSWLRVIATEGSITSPTDNPIFIENQGQYLLESNKFNVPILDSKKLEFDLKIKAIGKPHTQMRFIIIMETDDPVYKYAFLYAIRDGNGDLTGEYDFNFQRTINDNPPYDNISSGANVNVVNIYFNNEFGDKTVAVQAEKTISVKTYLADKWGFDLTNAKMFVRVYPNAWTDTDLPVPPDVSVVNVLKEITIDFKSDDQTPEGTVFQTFLLDNFTKPTEEKEVMTGDYQTFGQNGYLYSGRKDSNSIQYTEDGVMTKKWTSVLDDEEAPLLTHSLRQHTESFARSFDELRIGFRMPRINVLNRYAVRCVNPNTHLITEDGTHINDNSNFHILVGQGKCLNSKKYIFIEGEMDYFREHFSGILNQVVDRESDYKEYIYSYFDKKDIK